MTWRTLDTFYTEAEAVAFIDRAEAKGIDTRGWIIDHDLFSGRYSVLDMDGAS